MDKEVKNFTEVEVRVIDNHVIESGPSNVFSDILSHR